jgi:hypothetical protein
VDSIRPGDPVKILAMHDLRRDFRPRGKGCFQPGQGILRTLERGNETALVVQCFNDGVNAEDDVIGFPFTYPARGAPALVLAGVCHGLPSIVIRTQLTRANAMACPSAALPCVMARAYVLIFTCESC